MISDNRLGLGVGLDLPWQGPYGIVGGQVLPRTVRFLQRYAPRFRALFVSWQPRDKGPPSLDAVAPALDALFAQVPIDTRALHQTALNLAAVHYDRTPVVRLTNALIARYGLQWVNEDLGSWSVHGRPLPYPQPPPLSDDGVAHCIRTCAEVDAALDAPLVVEFPGVDTPLPWRHGALDAYDAFRRIVAGAGVRCNLDTGHLLTWRWSQGHRGAALLDDLDRLPLEHCVELHCAGARVEGQALVDAHHGVLHELQLQLVERLTAQCPNLRLVTYEDPRFDDQGVLPEAAERSLDALERRVQAWMRRPGAATGVPAPQAIPPAATQSPWEDALAASFEAPSTFGRRCRRQLWTRSAFGVGLLPELYPAALEARLGPDPRPDDVDALLLAFVRSPEGRAWSEFAWAVPGRCIEDAFGMFLAPGSREHLQACARVLAVHEAPPFAVPSGWSRAPSGWFAVADVDPPVLYAVTDGNVRTGPITPLVAEILRGARPPGASEVVARLAAMGLVDAPV